MGHNRNNLKAGETRRVHGTGLQAEEQVCDERMHMKGLVQHVKEFSLLTLSPLIPLQFTVAHRPVTKRMQVGSRQVKALWPHGKEEDIVHELQEFSLRCRDTIALCSDDAR